MLSELQPNALSVFVVQTATGKTQLSRAPRLMPNAEAACNAQNNDASPDQERSRSGLADQSGVVGPTVSLRVEKWSAIRVATDAESSRSERWPTPER